MKYTAAYYDTQLITDVNFYWKCPSCRTFSVSQELRFCVCVSAFLRFCVFWCVQKNVKTVSCLVKKLRVRPIKSDQSFKKFAKILIMLQKFVPCVTGSVRFSGFLSGFIRIFAHHFVKEILSSDCTLSPVSSARAGSAPLVTLILCLLGIKLHLHRRFCLAFLRRNAIATSTISSV